jgi:hypothetical protein
MRTDPARTCQLFHQAAVLLLVPHLLITLCCAELRCAIQVQSLLPNPDAYVPSLLVPPAPPGC